MERKELPKRKSIRLKDYDYSQAGYYFVTICTYNREKILGDIVGNDALVVPSEIGNRIIECWNNISLLNDHVNTDTFCLMPNHIHGIIMIENQPIEISSERKYGCETTERRGRRSLQDIVKDFKSVTTRHYNKMVSIDSKNTLWQKSYYEHIIRNEQDLQEIQEYIMNNPAKWHEDKYFND